MEQFNRTAYQRIPWNKGKLFAIAGAHRPALHRRHADFRLAATRSSVRAVPVAIEYWRQLRRRRISSAFSHSGRCTRSMKRHLSPQLPHTTDLPLGSARPLKVRLNSVTSDRCSVCWQALMRRLSTPGRQRCVEVGAALWTEVKIPPDSIVVAPAEVKGAFWAAQCVTDRRAEGYEYAEDH
jgi:hypothetical protein